MQDNLQFSSSRSAQDPRTKELLKGKLVFASGRGCDFVVCIPELEKTQAGFSAVFGGFSLGPLFRV